MTELHEHPTDSSWAYRWHSRLGLRELAYVIDREVWLSRFRHVDPDTGELAAWTPPLPVDLPIADDEDHARRLAEQHARSAP